jgi:hypothetical protein
MTKCPFHDDHEPSLKLNGDYFYCFGCGAHGDVVDFTAKLFGVGLYEAARKLASDFGIPAGGERQTTTMTPIPYSDPPAQSSRERERLCFSVLSAYVRLLRIWKETRAPASPDDEPDDRFAIACRDLDRFAYFLDILLEGGEAERSKLVEQLMDQDKIFRLMRCLTDCREEYSGEKQSCAG